MALKLALYTFGGLLLLYISNHFFANRILSVILLLATVLPIFFIGSIMKYFRREVSINLEDLFLSIAIQNQFNKGETSLKLYFDEISSYTMQFPARKFYTIILNLKNGKSVEYSFIKNEQNTEQVSGEELLKMFHEKITNYNNKLNKEKKIVVKPSFIASKNGLFCITGLICLFAVAVILHAFYQVKTFPITLLFCFALVAQLLSKRKADLDIYKTLSN